MCFLSAPHLALSKHFQHPLPQTHQLHNARVSLGFISVHPHHRSVINAVCEHTEDYGRNHNLNYWGHDCFTQLLSDTENILCLLNFWKKTSCWFPWTLNITELLWSELVMNVFETTKACEIALIKNNILTVFAFLAAEIQHLLVY